MVSSVRLRFVHFWQCTAFIALVNVGTRTVDESPRHNKQKQLGSMKLSFAPAGYGLPPEEKALKGARIHRKCEEAKVMGDIDITGIVLLVCDMIHMHHIAH